MRRCNIPEFVPAIFIPVYTCHTWVHGGGGVIRDVTLCKLILYNLSFIHDGHIYIACLYIFTLPAFEYGLFWTKED